MKPDRRNQDDVVALVKDEVPAAWFSEAVKVVATAQRHINNGGDRREWAVSLLMQSLHIPESVARLLVELGVIWYRRKWEPADELASVP
jgi:hypothetical protein